MSSSEQSGQLSAAPNATVRGRDRAVGRQVTDEERIAGDFRLLIDGKLVEGAGALDVINPATGRVLAAAPRADRAQLEEAVAAAKAAFPAWSARPLRERGGLLVELAEALEEGRDEFARLVTEEQGKPLPHALGEIAFSVAVLRYFAALDLPPEMLKEDAAQKVVRHRKPLGVVAAITPWNFPVLLLMIEIAPALLAGNTVVAKPAPTTPLATLKFGELCARVLPAGVVNIIVDRSDLGDALTGHPDVAKVAFTGSTATGKKVMQSASRTLKRVTLELGGNDAAIVLDDADPKEVAPKIYEAAMANAGQACIAIKRLYVHDSIYDAVCDELGRLARETVVGDGLEPGTQMGPIQNRAQFERVKGFLEDARKNGKIVAGGGTLDREGYFVRPTIVRDMPDDARLVREEQFGPVLPVLRYSEIDDAVARANDTDFGLGGSVWSSDRDRAYGVAARIHSGTVWVNKQLDVGLDTPFSGAKQSGLGTEMGREGLEEFTQATIINVANYRPPAGFEADWEGLYIQQAPPDDPRGGVLSPVEGGRWLVSLIGGDGDYPPTDEAGFLAFARGLRSPALYEAIAGAEPLTPIAGQRATENLLRHYDRLEGFPDGVVAVGDAVSAFNPVYGQGMTAAALGAEALDRWLRGRSSRRGPWRGRAFQSSLARATAVAWRLSMGADHRFRTTEGPPQGRAARLVGRYLDEVMRASTRRPWVRRRLAEVLHMLRPPSALFGPGVLARLGCDWLAGLAGAGYRRVRPLREGADGGSRSPHRTAADFGAETVAGRRG
jgi:acyl-CoA reductase-like NAD-dependent aldehyde dehydrogenase